MPIPPSAHREAAEASLEAFSRRVREIFSKPIEEQNGLLRRLFGG
jgi:hypothetical protein